MLDRSAILLKILLGLSTEGQGDHLARALAISVPLFVAVAALYVWGALSCCRRRRAPRSASAGDDSTGPEFEALWTIHNKRYKLDEFVAAHPGGVDSILLGKGRNCTELYESYHSLANEKLVRATLARYYVEDAPPGAPDYEDRFEWQTTPFYDELKSRVRAYFAGKKATPLGKAYHADWWMLAYLSVNTIAFFCCLFGFMRGQVIPMLLLGPLHWYSLSIFMHDCGHFALCRYPWINSFLANLAGGHTSSLAWAHQHTVGHHVYTNIANHDPDLYHFTIGADYGIPGFRTSVEQRTMPEKAWDGTPRSAWWRRGLKFRAFWTTFGPCIAWDVHSLMIYPKSGQGFMMGMSPYKPLTTKELIVHSIGRAFVLWIALIHPVVICLLSARSWLTGLPLAMIFATVPYSIHGCIYYMFSQVSHVQGECFTVKADEVDHQAARHVHPTDRVAMTLQPTPADAPKVQQPPASPARVEKKEEWAVHQAEHAFDYAVDTFFWKWASDGLNSQIVHHIFPQISFGHYKDLHPIVQEVCQKFGVKYTTVPTYREALCKHIQYIKSINDDEQHGSIWVVPPQGKSSRTALKVLGEVDKEWRQTSFGWSRLLSLGAAGLLGYVPKGVEAGVDAVMPLVCSATMTVDTKQA